MSHRTTWPGTPNATSFRESEDGHLPCALQVGQKTSRSGQALARANLSAGQARAGTGSWFADERHLWPAWYWLISQCKPATIFGEQVTGPDARWWFDVVSTDMEKAGYRIGAAVLPAASVGAPHKRDRLWFLADSESGRCKPGQEVARCHTANPGGTGDNAGFGGSGKHANFTGGWEWVECSDGKQRPIEPGILPLAHGVPGRVGQKWTQTERGKGCAT